MKPLRPALLLLAVAIPTAASAQGYRVRLDSRVQAVSYRGLVLDSIPVSQVVTSPTGGLVSPEGFAVKCAAEAWCHFRRPGPEFRGIPLSTTASLVLWGLGVPGLSAHAVGRLVTDAGSDDAWPATEPTAQLLEGFLEYNRGSLLARGGRLLVMSRLEPIGFDGGWARFRWAAQHLEMTGYGGWGLGQAAVVPVASPALDPLDEWRPRERQLVAGLEAAWSPGPADVRAEYRREIDPETHEYVSERTAISATTRTWRSFRANGGADWNLAEGHFGSADLAVAWLGTRLTVTAGARRYRPYFSLWTLWGAFNPIPYNAVHGSVQATANDWFTLRMRGERFWFEDTEASTALVQVEDRGWRTSAGVTLTPLPRLTVHADWRGEFGPGASSRSIDAMASYAATDVLSFSLYGGTLDRPLELRFYDAEATWIGGRAEWRPGNQWRAWGDVAWFDQASNRPDPAASSLDQFRLRGGISVTFGSSADRLPLPPARRGQP